ncbi:MAG: sigma-70 family RNA polymerase sigma factor [Rhizomicrobium sp.]|jgi:RNA polymerase sigma-70 factor (ECF subfamily)
MDRTDRIRWVAREILPHEPAVRSWLARHVRGLPNCDIDDLIQEAYARLWAAETERIVSPKAYFFVVVRHLVGEALRRSRIVSIEMLADVDSLNIVDEEGSPERRVSAREELGRLQKVLERMPAKCRLAFELRKFDGCSQREIAARMGIAESTVEKHLAKALKFLMTEMTSPFAEERNWSMRSDESRRKWR